MKIRKYIARNMPEALQQVRDDFGENAVILNTRQLRRNSRFNNSDQPQVEVTAAVDEIIPSENVKSENFGSSSDCKLNQNVGSPEDVLLAGKSFGASEAFGKQRNITRVEYESSIKKPLQGDYRKNELKNMELNNTKNISEIDQ